MLLKAIKAHQAGELGTARAVYERILRRNPGDADALNFLGMLECQQGNLKKGVQLLRNSLREAPANPHAWINLGNALAQIRALEDAIEAFEKAAELAPDLWQPWYNRGVLLRQTGRFEEALACMKKALLANPDHNLTYKRIGDLLARLGRMDEARQVYEEWFAYNPSNPMARHMHAATSGQKIPQRAADDYVVELFDNFAASFDEVLENLGYQAPQLVAQAIEHRLGEPGASEPRDILDAGCGTGLCGPLLRPWARRLTGVDLSSGMVKKARARGAYDELVVRELCQFMNSRADQFDVVVSADTLVYFGDLGAAMAAAHHCLRRNGLLVFTVERLDGDDATATFRLESHGRYSHAKGYICAVLAEAGFEMVGLDHRVLRKELNQDVEGLLVVARRQ
jgi:predicted TPR repeat methyltransferase